MTTIRRGFAAFLAAIMAVSCALGTTALTPAPAAAEDLPRVAGVDYMETGTTRWEVLRAQGMGNRPIYLDVQERRGDITQQLAKFQPYTVPADEQADGEGERVANIIWVNMTDADARPVSAADVLADIDNHPLYTITVHSDKREGVKLYEGTVYPVYAEVYGTVDGSAPAEGAALSLVERKLIGIRTASADERERNLGVGETYYRLGESDTPTSYALAMQSGLDNAFNSAKGCFIVRYEQAQTASISGSVNYVDTEGAVVRTTPVANLTAEPQAVRLEKSFFVGEDYYRAIGMLGGTTAKLSLAKATHTVRVIKVQGMDVNAYPVTINYRITLTTDASAAPLWSDEVDVKGDGYQYTLPQTFSMKRASGVDFYQLKTVSNAPVFANGESGAKGTAAAPVEWSNPLKFNTAADKADFHIDAASGRRTLNAFYEPTDVSKLAQLTVVEVDGSTGLQLGTKVLDITPDQTASYMPEPFTRDGVDYVPWQGTSDAISVAWSDLAQGVELLRTVYYVPTTYTPGAAYDITIRYLNVANGATIRTQPLTVDPERNDFVTFTGEERFTQDGNTYVRLPGQEQGIRHAFLSTAREYAVYYRDVDDVLNANTTITRVEILNTTRPVVTPAPAPATLTGALAPVPAAGDAGAGVDAGVAAGPGTAIINDDDNPLAGVSGQDTASERTIEDNENPLSSGAQNEQALPDWMGLALGFGLVALGVGVAVLLVFLYRRMSTTTGTRRN